MSKIAGAVFGEGVASGAESTIQELQQVGTYFATDGKLGDNVIDPMQILLGAASGATVGGAFRGVDVGLDRLNLKSASHGTSFGQDRGNYGITSWGRNFFNDFDNPLTSKLGGILVEDQIERWKLNYGKQQ